MSEQAKVVGFTPGPWGVGPKATQVCSTPLGAMKDAPDSRYVHRLLAVTTGLDGRSESENEANARLIAASPELYRVAQDYDEVLTELGLHCECGNVDCRTTRLRAALAAARGEQ